MINCEMGAEGAIVDGVKTIDDVKEVSGVFGNYDIIIKVECSDIEDLRDIITRKIRHLDQVKCTTTLMCAN
ncbi:Lrp/AsnC ligand binding domain-containing protein [Nitrosotalea sinensis]|nr:Lrp/AsnC ligand binding domain-containing protein [Candidatus Nitrosotalea sinensis]